MSGGSFRSGPLSGTDPRLAGLINENATEKPDSGLICHRRLNTARDRNRLKVGIAAGMLRSRIFGTPFVSDSRSAAA
jgi:hypothetical protein